MDVNAVLAELELEDEEPRVIVDAEGAFCLIERPAVRPRHPPARLPIEKILAYLANPT